MDDRGGVVHHALEGERLYNARRINAFRLAGLLIALTVEIYFAHAVRGWIGAPIALFVGWTSAALVLLVAGLLSDRIARLGGLAIAFVDMPLLCLLISRVVDALELADSPRRHLGSRRMPPSTTSGCWCSPRSSSTNGGSWPG
jgi:hypothetical protein